MHHRRRRIAANTEALVCLFRSWQRWRFTPFRESIESSSIPLPKSKHPDAESQIDALMCAVNMIADRVPFRAACYQKGLAAQYMLRRRGIDATLHYGVRPTEAELLAHVWISVEAKVVMGGSTMEGFAEVARFPQ